MPFEPVEPDPGQASVLAHERGRMLVLGAPGTGKTTVLRERLAALLERGADPERVVLVVPTKRARAEARAALLARVRASVPDLHVTTVHGLAHRVLAARHAALAYDRPPRVLTAPEQFALVHDLLRGEDAADWPAYGGMLGLRGFADQVRQFLLRAQEALLAPDDILRRAEAEGLSGWRELAGFYKRYLQVLDDQRAVDFAGLLVQAAAAAARGDPPFDHVLVDDYQDATFAAERLLADLGATTLVVAGDPESHVFSFRGTTRAPLRRFRSEFAPVLEVRLARDHRGTARAHEAWATEHTSEEHAAIARELRRAHVEEGVAWRDLAVVVRRHGSHVGGLLRALDDARIPRTDPGGWVSLLAEPATRPLVLALQWIAGSEDVRDAIVEPLLASDLVRMSPAAARGLVRSATAAGHPPSAALARVEEIDPAAPADVRAAAEALRDAQAAAGSALDAFRRLWTGLPHARRLVEDGAARDLDAVLALSDAVARHAERPDPSVASFLESLGEADEGPGQPAALGVPGPDAVQVLTAHAAAGREFDTVLVAGAVEGDFPSLSRPEPMFDLDVLEGRSSQAERNRLRLEDERRLFRVVASRARRRVVFLASRPEGDEASSARSRFVAELGVPWAGAAVGPFEQPVTVAEAAASWRRCLADEAQPGPRRVAALDGLIALGENPSRWWFQREWTRDDRPLHERLRVSFSKLEKLENCELQFVLSEELGLESRAGYQAWVGSLVHRLVEECELGLIERSLDALVAEAERRWKREEFPSRAVSEAYRRLVTGTMLPGWFREYGRAPALEREVRFEFEFEGASVTGYIDRIAPCEGGGTQITDYKTGKIRNAGKADENLQLGIYFLAVNHAEELAKHRPVRAVELAFLRDRRDGLVARASKGFTSSEQGEYRRQMTERLAGLVHRLEELQVTERYRPNPAANCRFCDFRPLCPLWPEGGSVLPEEVGG